MVLPDFLVPGQVRFFPRPAGAVPTPSAAVQGFQTLLAGGRFSTAIPAAAPTQLMRDNFLMVGRCRCQELPSGVELAWSVEAD